MRKNICFIMMMFIVMVVSGGCFLDSNKSTKPMITIATNSWIGYAPLFYAQETGELEKEGFRLLTNVSLAEAAEIFNVGKADMVTTTQHEYYMLKEMIKDIVPVILLDRSNGGDMILANKSLQELKKAKKIYVYLEVDSINSELFSEFVKKRDLSKKEFIYINEDQQKILDVKNNPNKTILIVTYTPYDVELRKKGFEVIASTKDIHDLVIIDALCARTKLLATHKEKLQRLKKLIDTKIEAIKKDPKQSYRHVKKYLGNISYKEYEDALDSIEWINKPSKELLQIIEKMGYKKETLLL